MHADLAGYVSAASQALALFIHDDQVSGAHGSLAQAGGCDQDLAILQADREVAVHCRHESAPVQHTPVADNFIPVFAFGRHWFLRGEWRRSAIWQPHSTSTFNDRTTQKKMKVEK